MADDNSVYKTAMSGYQALILDEQNAYQQATLTDDFSEQVRASQSLAAIRTQMQEYHRMASERAQSMRPSAAANKYGLSPEEVEVAQSVPDRRDYRDGSLTPEQKEAVYAQNKAKLLRLRASGTYRQTTEQTG